MSNHNKQPSPEQKFVDEARKLFLGIKRLSIHADKDLFIGDIPGLEWLSFTEEQTVGLSSDEQYDADLDLVIKIASVNVTGENEIGEIATQSYLIAFDNLVNYLPEYSTVFINTYGGRGDGNLGYLKPVEKRVWDSIASQSFPPELKVLDNQLDLSGFSLDASCLSSAEEVVRRFGANL